MGEHIINGEFQSDKYPTTPRGKVPLSTKDPLAQDLLWEYAQRRRAADAEFSADLETALLAKGFKPVEDAPGGPYSTAYTADNPKLWIVLRKGDTEEQRDWIFHGTEPQAIAVRDALNRIQGGGETDG